LKYFKSKNGGELAKSGSTVSAIPLTLSPRVLERDRFNTVLTFVNKALRSLLPDSNWLMNSSID